MGFFNPCNGQLRGQFPSRYIGKGGRGMLPMPLQASAPARKQELITLVRYHTAKQSIIYLFFFFLLTHQKEAKMLFPINRNRCALWSLSGVETPFRLCSMNVSIKKISACRCLGFASWPKPLHIAKPKRLRKPKLKIFLHALRKSTSCSDCRDFDIHKIYLKMFLFFSDGGYK